MSRRQRKGKGRHCTGGGAAPAGVTTLERRPVERPESVRHAVKSQAAAASRPPPADFLERNRYVLWEIRRSFAVAGIVFAVLIALYFLIRE